jgi:AraC-like DNA-binding protein
MANEERFGRFVAGNPILLTSGARLHWDGIGAVYQDVELEDVSEYSERSAVPVQNQPIPGHRARAPMAPRMTGLMSSIAPAVINGDQEAACFTFALDPRLLMGTVHDVVAGATGILVWGCQDGHAVCLTPAVHPALFVYTAYEPLHGERIELVSHLLVHDPLRHHIALVLQATSDADSVEGRLYAETLANALAVHFLRRYTACKQTVQESTSALSTYKLRQTIAYIQAHLEQKLSLTALAAVVHLSPDHFARLFKHATGRTPHQYVLWCRIERAKQLLAETDVPLSAIGLQVGCTDQSSFTALFRKHVIMTPKAYRAAIHRA